jgi:hypothetical protein
MMLKRNNKQTDKKKKKEEKNKETHQTTNNNNNDHHPTSNELIAIESDGLDGVRHGDAPDDTLVLHIPAPYALLKAAVQQVLRGARCETPDERLQRLKLSVVRLLNLSSPQLALSKHIEHDSRLALRRGNRRHPLPIDRSLQQFLDGS